MAADLPPSDRIILTATALNGDALALVAYPDGSCSITREGKPVPGSNWKPCDVPEATQLLLKLAQLS